MRQCVAVAYGGGMLEMVALMRSGPLMRSDARWEIDGTDRSDNRIGVRQNGRSERVF